MPARRRRGAAGSTAPRLLLAACLLAAGVAPAGAMALTLERLAQPGPWSGISGIIGYRGRIWFVNSEKFRNHNSADLYVLDPRTGRTRYARALFSQDVGEPAVAGGLLYWPHEDSRFSPGRGEFTVTNGRDWAVRVLPEGRAFHLHAMLAQAGTLYAAYSAWRAGLQASRDGGATWRVVYEQETPPGRVSRITSLATLDGTLYAGLVARYEESAKLLRRRDGEVSPVPGWPRGLAARTLTRFEGWLYATVETRAEPGVWRTDGSRVERVRALDGLEVQDLAAGAGRLWAAVADRGSGRLMSSPDGIRWSAAYRFSDASPIDVAVVAGRVYVGTMASGGGALWGEIGPEPVRVPAPADPLPALPARPAPRTGAALERALAVLDRTLLDPAAYRSGARDLRRAFDPFVLAGGRAAGMALSRRLALPFPAIEASLIGGLATPAAADVARWYLLRAIGFSGYGRIPVRLLAAPWRARPNRAEKYFEVAPAAIWAAARIGQDDAATLGALVDRLSAPGDPDWLGSDVISALTLLTGRPFAYDRAAWRDWWRRQSGGGEYVSRGLQRR